MIRIALLIVNICYEIWDPEPDSINQVRNQAVALLMFVSWFSVLAHLKYIPSLRVLIRMMTLTLEDMGPFLIVVVVMLISFTMTFAF